MAIQSLLIIIVILAVLLVIGVPISYAIGISSLICILQTVSLDISVVTCLLYTSIYHISSRICYENSSKKVVQ